MESVVRIRWIGAAGLISVGLVWIGQGLGILRGASFMGGDPIWAAIGAFLVACGAFVAWLAFRSAPKA